MGAASDAAKHDLRTLYLEQRRALTPAALRASREAVAVAVLARLRSAGWRRVAAYVPLRTEPGSHELLAALEDAGVEVLVPHVLPDRDLDWLTWRAGVADPEHPRGPGAIATVDAALVPALAVADDGTRLGRGGGSYDRALARVPDGVTIAALLHDGERPHHLPADDWDQRVGAVATPAGWEELE